jgi:uncharacterized protein DUF4340
MGVRGTLVLALLVLIAGAYAYHDIASQPELSWDTVLGEGRPTPLGQGGDPLVPFAPRDVEGVKLSRDGVELAAHRTQNGWSGVAQGKTIDDFLDGIATLSRIMTIDIPADQLADHGLAPPRAVIDLEPKSGPPLAIRIGDRNPPATAVYVQLGGEERVVLTGALILWELEKALNAAKDAGAANR